MVNVIVIDDSAIVRKMVSEVLSHEPTIGKIESAHDPVFALEKMNETWPDVIILDVEMPRMDGITFLKKIMRERPTPIIIFSSLTQAGAEVTVQALAAGAVEIIAKPSLGLKQFIEDSARHLLDAVKAASQSNLAGLILTGQNQPIVADIPEEPHRLSRTTEKVVVIGTSAGGTQALERILSGLPATVPGIAIVQHMPEKFTAAFANRLNQICQLQVREVRDGDYLVTGTVLIAQGNRHMQLKRSGARYHLEVVDGPPVSRHRPSVNVLFRSAAKHAGKNALGVIMTGMGDDGAAGLLEMKKAGALTVAQDEQTSVVFGMPREAIHLGAAQLVQPLQEIPGTIVKFGREQNYEPGTTHQRTKN